MPELPYVHHALHAVCKPECTPDNSHHGKCHKRKHELQPSLVEVVKHINCRNTSSQIYEEQFDSVRSGYQHRQQRYEIYKKHQSPGKECKQIKDYQRKRNHIEIRRFYLYNKEGRYCRKRKDEQDIQIFVKLLEYMIVAEVYREEKDQHQKQCDQCIPKPLKELRSVISDIRLIFFLV